MQTSSTIDITRINSDTNGNPRYVLPYRDLLTKEELDCYILQWSGVSYNLALERAKTIGGRKFHNRQYGGGIVFCTYGSLEREVQQAFISFECSKDYTKAHDALFLTIINDAEMHNACLNIVGHAFNPRTASRNTHSELMYIAGLCADSLKIRCSANAKWLAGCMLAVYFERLHKEIQAK